MDGCNDHETQFQYLITKLREVIHCEDELPKDIKQKLFNFICQYKKKFQNVSRNNQRLETKYSSWLDTCINFPSQARRSVSDGSVGRRQKNFVECSDRSKRRKTQELRSNTGTMELTYAVEIKFRSEGNRQAAKILCDIVKSPDAAKTYINKNDVKIVRLTEDKAHSLVANARLTKYQYNIIKSNALEENCPLYPNYQSVIKAKKRWYPDNIVITESSAEVPVQDLVDHTMKRLALSPNDLFSRVEDNNIENLWLPGKLNISSCFKLGTSLMLLFLFHLWYLYK